MLKKLDEKTIRFHLRKSFVTFAKRIIKDNRTFRRRMRTLGASTFCLKQTKWYKREACLIKGKINSG